ncbi:MFS transporter [Micromonospora echinofusca]|uniref:MFS transporter n=1 Tax=Micromonospora echinofusca TaxID=47858 RepID=A0ABS3VP00_MICEH|nr:MFS transporter [Micromonospora echinofusca]MBO4206133.1 MFS transporter [Micromonospora echinofusca]
MTVTGPAAGPAATPTVADPAATPETAGSAGPPEVAPPTTRRGRLTGNRDFLLLWTGAGVSALGSRATSISYTLLVFWSTGSATAASLVTFAALLPNLVAQLPAGVLVDRWDRRRTMLWCNVGRILAIGSVAVAVARDTVWLPHLMAVAFVEATLGICYALAERAAVFNVVPAERYGAATAANESRANAASILGQPAGTLLYAVTRWAPFGFAALMHLISLATLIFVRRDLQAPQPDTDRGAGLLARMREGFAFVWGQLYLRRAIGLFAASNILFQVLGLGLVVIVKAAGGSPPTVGLLLVVNSVFGMAGAMTSNFYLSRWGIRRIIMTVNVGWAVLMSLIGFAPNLILLGAIFALIHYGAGIGNVAGMLYVFRTAPDRLRGRAGSIVMLLTSGANSLGALLAGFLLDSTAVSTAMSVVGGAMAVIALLSVLGFGGRAAAEAERREAAEQATAGGATGGPAG